MKLTPKYQTGTPENGVKTFIGPTLPEITVTRLTQPSRLFGFNPTTVVTVEKPKDKQKKSSWKWKSARTRQFTGNSVATPVLKGFGYIGEGINSVLANLATPNASPTGMYSVQTPQQAQANRNIQQNVKQTMNETVWPAVTPSNYAVALSEGSLNPYLGAEVKSKWTPMQQALTIPFDLWASKKVGQGVKAVGNAAKTFTRSSEVFPRGLTNNEPLIAGGYNPVGKPIELTVQKIKSGQFTKEDAKQYLEGTQADKLFETVHKFGNSVSEPKILRTLLNKMREGTKGKKGTNTEINKVKAEEFAKTPEGQLQAIRNRVIDGTEETIWDRLTRNKDETGIDWRDDPKVNPHSYLVGMDTDLKLKPVGFDNKNRLYKDITIMSQNIFQMEDFNKKYLIQEI